MIKVDNREIVFSTCILAPDDKEIEIETLIMGSTFRLLLIFNNKEPGGPQLQWFPERNALKIIFKGWRNTLGTSMKQPIKIGSIGNQHLGFMACHWRLGEMNRIDFQVMLGGVYEQ